MIDLEILGPLVVRVRSIPVRLGPTLRTLLLGLLCAHGELVPASRLASMVSDTGVAEGSAATLRSHISHLRGALRLGDAGGVAAHAPVLVTDRVGGSAAYALRVDPDRIDASRFERYTAAGIRELHSGHFERGSELLRAAISLWRGQPLADAAGRAFAQAETRRLEGMYRSALIGRYQADVQQGLCLAVIGELEATAEQWPDDEAVRVLLVICLYRSGRLAEAAQACRIAVEAALEHGLDSHRVAALQRDVLTGSLAAAGSRRLGEHLWRAQESVM